MIESRTLRWEVIPGYPDGLPAATGSLRGRAGGRDRSEEEAVGAGHRRGDAAASLDAGWWGPRTGDRAPREAGRPGRQSLRSGLLKGRSSAATAGCGPVRPVRDF